MKKREAKNLAEKKRDVERRQGQPQINSYLRASQKEETDSLRVLQERTAKRLGEPIRKISQVIRRLELDLPPLPHEVGWPFGKIQGASSSEKQKLS
jgi:hypothetical protein